MQFFIIIKTEMTKVKNFDVLLSVIFVNINDTFH